MRYTYKNLEMQYKKLFRHLKVGSFKTRERYGKAFKRFMRYLAHEYNLQKLTNIAPKHIFAYVEYMQSKGGLTRYVPINETIRITLRDMLEIIPRGQKLFVAPHDKTHLAMKRLQCFIAYRRKEYTENRITFHGLRHTYAHEQYDKFIKDGCSEYEARKKVSELLGHHRDDVTRIYLAE